MFNYKGPRILLLTQPGGSECALSSYSFRNTKHVQMSDIVFYSSVYCVYAFSPVNPFCVGTQF